MATKGASDEGFLLRHWPDAIRPQGKPPDGFTPIEAALAPEACGSCHVQQFEDWQTSLHSRSMGPGVAGQLIEMTAADPDSANLCWSCHSPLWEQKPLAWSDENGWQTNPDFDASLQQHGMTCAACHVRDHQRFGPPPRGDPDRTGPIASVAGTPLPHRGFVAESAFGASGFCKGCHQFGPEDYAINGKLIENTYEEWASSRYRAAGIDCQDCHMPDRRHLWRGIHDRDMTRNGVTIGARLAALESDGVVRATVTVVNSNTGHLFPTYLTPKVFVRGYLLDGTGSKQAASLQEYPIGRESHDLVTEEYDTRLAPDESVTIAYEYPRDPSSHRLRLEVEVDPDHWYRRFYENLLASGDAGRGEAMIQAALQTSKQSAFLIYEREFPLDEVRTSPEP